ncbi:hypothetical protein OUZ56_004770 [Daphnia magna]|uniref:Uncharacterized protein n=1 Tax=Daphnia magna TaxID=35525 RepID=A0ABQ9YR20_9CRUS|nr:hypothetical protein OUZ56_004770 [Daphnia magna]
MKKWEGYTLTTFVKIRKKRHLLESNEIAPVQLKLNEFSQKMKKWEGYTLTTFVKIRKKRHLLESNEIAPNLAKNEKVGRPLPLLSKSAKSDIS